MTIAQVLKHVAGSVNSSLEIREDIKHIAVFKDSDKVFECSIEALWDMLRENLVIVNVKADDHSLLRRKKEALAAKVVSLVDELGYFQDK
jgi:hypothetical protein